MNKQYGHLSPEERDEISRCFWLKLSIREIAYRLRRSPCTISRELRRNGTETYRVYHARIAQLRTIERKKRAHQRPRLKHGWIRWYVRRKLKLGWSPEQIVGRLKTERPESSISHEAIYQFVYDPIVRRKYDLVRLLPRAHRKRRKKGQRRIHQNSRIPCRIGISERLQDIVQRTQFGHWESDAVISRSSPSALNVTVERMTRFTKITKMTAKSTGKPQRQSCVRCRSCLKLPGVRSRTTMDQRTPDIC